MKGKVDSMRDIGIMILKGEMCAGDALIGYGKDLRGIGLRWKGKGKDGSGMVVRSIGEEWVCSESALNCCVKETDR